MPVSQAGCCAHQVRRTRPSTGLVEALRRHPHLRLRVVLAQVRGLLFEQREQVPRLGVARVAAGDEHGVDARQLREHLAPLLERELDGLRVGSSPCPSPDTRSTRPGRTRRRSATSPTIISIGGSGKCGLSAASSDRGGISSMALVPKTARSRMYCSHMRHVPAVVGVRLRPVAELVPAKRDPGCRRRCEDRRRATDRSASCAARAAIGRRRRARRDCRCRARAPWEPACWWCRRGAGSPRVQVRARRRPSRPPAPPTRGRLHGGRRQ